MRYTFLIYVAAAKVCVEIVILKLLSFVLFQFLAKKSQGYEGNDMKKIFGWLSFFGNFYFSKLIDHYQNIL